MRLSICGVATAVCLIASVLAQDNQSSSNTNAVTRQPQSSQSQTQAASSSAANSNSQSQASSGSNSQSSASTSSAPPVTSVYSTAFETYSVSNSQTISYTSSGNVTTVIQPGSTSKTPVTLPTAASTIADGDAGGAATITAPDPGNTSFRNSGPDDNYTTNWGGKIKPVATVFGAGVALVLIGASLV
ncbi:hypothetical protein FFLO_01595 [Filobasidium floriforme]|uniref:Uncharacterized protein n=1 Tax=Filobasidium floriforme TaxID=5210 RepID=A0A8K0JP69_9TREE|nr:uncharacterized protein HD553DRAFT_344933 [Filobasidium floriforme]KAG7562905.1 hypothetical protein FFLO_01595 [Filobasidium floriforme]KAH8080646.1 hypothetical protein HD553DRAFT_344933 [Filobasidium floriforme]